LLSFEAHIGSSLQSGHYYSFIKESKTKKWSSFNDSTVTQDVSIDLVKRQAEEHGVLFCYQITKAEEKKIEADHID
jgi:uncharacterized UBP type Zn finger protein